MPQLVNIKVRLILLVSFLLSVTCAPALSQTSDRGVVEAYLTSLSTGDTNKILGLVDGVLKRKSQRLFSDPDYYSNYLKEQYAGVTMSIMNIKDKNEKKIASVKAEYPSSDVVIFKFILADVDGVWKIVDEISDD